MRLPFALRGSARTGCGSSRRWPATATAAALGIDAYVASTLYGPGPEQAARRDGHMGRVALARGVWAVPATAAGPSGVYALTSGGSGFRAPDGTPPLQAGPEPGAVVSVPPEADRTWTRTGPSGASRP